MTKTHSAAVVASRLETALAKYQQDVSEGFYDGWSDAVKSVLRADFTAGWVACLDALAELDREASND